MNDEGCNVKTSFFMSTIYQDIDFLLKLFKEGYKELYYEAPYYWGVAHPKKKQIITYTEGDIRIIDCPSMRSFIKEIEEYLNFVKENYSSRSVWAEGEEFIKELKENFKE